MSDAPAPTMTESQLMTLALADALLKDGKLGSTVRAKAREMFPDKGLTFPEDRFESFAEPLRDENKLLRERLEAIETKAKADAEAQAERDLKRTLDQQLDEARAKYNLTGEGFDKMVERMKQTGNYGDAEAAAAWVAAQEPKPKAAGPSWAPSATNFFGSKNYDEAFKLLHMDPQEYQDDQLRQFSEDPDGYVRETFGV